MLNPKPWTLQARAPMLELRLLRGLQVLTLRKKAFSCSQPGVGRLAAGVGLQRPARHPKPRVQAKAGRVQASGKLQGRYRASSCAHVMTGLRPHLVTLVRPDLGPSADAADMQPLRPGHPSRRRSPAAVQAGRAPQETPSTLDP